MPNAKDLLKRLGIDRHPRLLPCGGADSIVSECPATGEPIATVRMDTAAELEAAIVRCVAVQKAWRMLPAPQRGEIVRHIGEEFRKHKNDLGELVTLEAGKIRAEGLGEIQECIDIADFSVGLSRQLYGNSMHSERPSHRMFEQWHPLGTIGCITAFNFPAAVWAWNSMLAATCGNSTLWKPSLITPVVAIACNEVAQRVMQTQTIFRPEYGDPRDVFGLVIGRDSEVGERMVADRRLPLISATGSCRMGRKVGQVVAGRLGRTLLELGGNNAIIVMPDADMKLVERAVVFGAVGTAGQRCTSTRRLIVHESIVEKLTEKLTHLYASIKIGDPMDESTLMGPLIHAETKNAMKSAIEQAVAQGCHVKCGGLPGLAKYDNRPGYFCEPTIISVPKGVVPAICREETFAPILYIFSVKNFEEAMEIHNGVDQGLSSAIFTDSVRGAERFLSHNGSDCGIANVNLGTSGAEIGGAFGGEKDTGGGRESGSDSWKQYMRRQTCTVNWGTDLPLAQGIRFGD